MVSWELIDLLSSLLLVNLINWTGAFWQAEKGIKLEKGGLRCGTSPKRGVFTEAHTYTEHICDYYHYMKGANDTV